MESFRKEKDLEKLSITMKYQYQGQTYASKLEDTIQWVTDTEIEHIELEDIEKQLEKPWLSPKYKWIKRSGLVEETVFPQSVQAPEFILQVAHFYNPDTRQCVNADGKVVIDLSPHMLALVFHIPTRKEVFVEEEEDGEREWNQNVSQCKKNEWRMAWRRKENKFKGEWDFEAGFQRVTKRLDNNA